LRKCLLLRVVVSRRQAQAAKQAPLILETCALGLATCLVVSCYHCRARSTTRKA
jgi:hypothetical protein